MAEDLKRFEDNPEFGIVMFKKLVEIDKELEVALYDYDDFATLREAIRRTQRKLGGFVGAYAKHMEG